MADNNRLEDLLEEFLLLYKFVNKQLIADKLNSELSSKQFIEIYEKTDGEHSTRDIAASLREKCSHSKIATLWNKWAKAGIVIPAKQKGRYRAAFKLEEYGIASCLEESEE